nr:ATP-binding protein [Micromonospora sp. DSM 115978]
VILAGAAPGRGWRNPVPMVDVIRGAISEVEDYARVDITSVQPAATVGRAVGDMVHLLAELIENAASFSPPHTRIRIAVETVPNGYAIEIEDRGLGMPPDALVEANSRLADPLEFDPTNSARLGLFVVAQLSARH